MATFGAFMQCEILDTEGRGVSVSNWAIGQLGKYALKEASLKGDDLDLWIFVDHLPSSTPGRRCACSV